MSKNRNVNVDMADKLLESGIAGNVDAGVGIVPKTLGEYVAEFQQSYKSTAEDCQKRDPEYYQGVVFPVEEARRQIEMSRLIYEAQRSLDYWEFEEFWKKTGQTIYYLQVRSYWQNVSEHTPIL